MDEAIRAATLDAMAKVPKESCGFIVGPAGSETYIPATNTSEGNDHFRITKEEFAQVNDEHEVVALVHSHPFESAKPSEADLVTIERTGLPWLIIGVNPGCGGDEPRIECRWVEPTGFRLPLVGRTFAHGVVDCYSLIRDYYLWELNIELPNFDRADDWWDKGQNLYVDNFKIAGFVEVDKATTRLHDVLLINLMTPPEIPCHAGIYLDGNVILHHLPRRLSGRDVYGGYYQRHTVKVLRHNTLC